MNIVSDLEATEYSWMMIILYFIRNQKQNNELMDENLNLKKQMKIFDMILRLMRLNDYNQCPLSPISVQLI